MPVNVYQCRECQKRIEHPRRFGEPHPTRCKCSGGLRQVYQPFIFRMRRARYSQEASAGPDKHMSAMISEDELVRGK